MIPQPTNAGSVISPKRLPATQSEASIAHTQAIGGALSASILG